MQKYYVSHDQQQMGPYNLDEILQLVEKGTLSPLDYLYDQAKEDWVLFVDFPSLSEQVKAFRPEGGAPKLRTVSSEGGEKSASAATDREWFVLKGENKFGPFSFVDVIKMLQQGVVFEFDFAWNRSMEQWKRIAEIAEFDKESIRKLKDSSMPEIRQVFFRRRHKRVKYGGTLLIHDNQKVWKGQAVEISEGGAGIVMENSEVVPGQQLYLHFKPGDGVPPFNAICEVVSKQYLSEVSDPKTPVKYGLKFKTISSEAKKVLGDVTKLGEAA